MKYAFIGDDGWATYFGHFDISLQTFSDDMSTELKETLCDFGLAFYMIIGLFGYLCFSSKQPSKPKVFKEDKKLNEKKPAKKKSDLIANIIEIGIWLTIVCFSFYDLETDTFNYLMRIKLACFIAFSFEAGFVQEMIP